MQQLSITYFYPLTEQIDLDLDYTPCLKYEEDKRKDSLYVGNRLDQWGTTSIGYVAPNFTVANNGNPALIINEELMEIGVPISFCLEQKPNIFTRSVYKLLGFGWKVKQ